MAEHFAARLTDGATDTVQNGAQTLSTAASRDGELSHTRCPDPNMVKGQSSELAAPLHGDTDTTEQGHDLVAKVLPAFEAFVTVLPNAVHRSDAIRLAEDIFKVDLVRIAQT